MEQDTIIVRYKYDNCSPNDDFVCELTEFIDSYLIHNVKYMCTYLYNDLGFASTPNLLQIAFRYPGATRGDIILERLSSHRFKIVGFHFYTDVCFNRFAIYKPELANDLDKYIGKILDFSRVTLVNNGLEFTY